MTTTGHGRVRADKTLSTPTDDPPRARPTVLDQMGGPRGLVHSTIPVVVLVAADAFLSLPATIAVSVVGTVLAAPVVVRAFRRSTARLGHLHRSEHR